MSTKINASKVDITLIILLIISAMLQLKLVILFGWLTFIELTLHFIFSRQKYKKIREEFFN